MGIFIPCKSFFVCTIRYYQYHLLVFWMKRMEVYFMASTDFELQMEEEIKKRVEEMEADDYDMGVPFSKQNWAVVVIFFVVSLILVTIGMVWH